MDCLAEYNYYAQEKDELTLQKGDLIKNAKQIEEGWLFGELNGREGVFPDNFVKIIDKNSRTYLNNKCEISPIEVAAGSEEGVIRKARVLFQYSALLKDELSLVVGSLIDVYGEAEKGWLRARYNGRYGLIPSNFVDILSDSGDKAESVNTSKQFEIIASTQAQTNIGSIIQTEKVEDQKGSNDNTGIIIKGDKPASTTRNLTNQVVVRYPYRAENPDELNLEQGDLVTVLDRNLDDEGWWRGELAGKIGVFPDNFVDEFLPHAVIAADSHSCGVQPLSCENTETVERHGTECLVPANSPTAPPNKTVSPVDRLMIQTAAALPPVLTKNHEQTSVVKLPPGCARRTQSIPVTDVSTSMSYSSGTIKNAYDIIGNSDCQSKHTWSNQLHEQMDENAVHSICPKPTQRQGASILLESTFHMTKESTRLEVAPITDENEDEKRPAVIRRGGVQQAASNTNTKNKLPSQMYMTATNRNTTHTSESSFSPPKRTPVIRQCPPLGGSGGDGPFPPPPAAPMENHRSVKMPDEHILVLPSVLADMHHHIVDMKQHIDTLKETMVPRSELETLRSEMNQLRLSISKRLQILFNEIDDEKKLRLADQVELSRVRQIAMESDSRSIQRLISK